MPWNGYHLNVRKAKDEARIVEIFAIDQRIPTSTHDSLIERHLRAAPHRCLLFNKDRLHHWLSSSVSISRTFHTYGLRCHGTQVNLGQEVQLQVCVVVVVEDPMVAIQHHLHLEALLLTFPEGMSLPGEAGGAVKSTVQCVPKVPPATKHEENCSL